MLSAEEVCCRYRERGYDFICVSDHALPAFGFPVTDTRAFRTDGFTTIVGAAHAVEVYNHTSRVKTDRGDGTVMLDSLLALGHRLNALACDDAHFEFDDAFGAWVMVKAEERDPDALLAALKAGHSYSSTGAELHDIRFDGDELVVECSPATGVFLQGKGSRATQVVGRDLTCVRLPAHKLGRHSFMRVTVADAQGRRAWSNPFWRDEA